MPLKTFIYRFTAVIKYDLQNLLNLEFPNPAKPAKPTKPRVPIPLFDCSIHNNTHLLIKPSTV